MISAAVLFTLACAFVAAIDIDLKHDILNNTTVDKDVLRRLSAFLDKDIILNESDIDLINRTAHNLGVDKDLVARLSSLVNKGKPKSISRVKETYNSYGDENGNTDDLNMGPVESPDYASSVVLASDLLSLTSAVANVKEPVCREQGYLFLDGLLLNKRWALKMFDASAKSPQGLLFGSSYHLGNFDECVAIQDHVDSGVSIEGQFCLATINWNQSEETTKVRTGRGETLRWAVCVPSSCNAISVQEFVSSVLSHTVGNSTTVQVTERDCYTRRPLTVNNLDIAYLVVILFFLSILLLSTFFEIYMSYIGKKNQSHIYNLVVSFSIVNNIKKILSTKQHSNIGLECISGIKTLAMIFIIAGHACLFIASGPVMDAEAWDRLVRQPANAFMLNNTLLVDTFLMLSAFLFCRLLLLELDKRRGKINVLVILIFRYIRVTPAYLIVVFFYMTWLPKIGEGPLWEDRLLLEQERCMTSWWTNILYINNYVHTDKMCMFQSWYLSVDTQLFFIAPVFIYSLWRWRKFGPALLSVAIVITLLIPAIVTYKDNLDPTLLVYAKEFTDIISNYYFNKAYIKTHMKMITYFMGILTGYILHRVQSENYQLSRIIKTFGWMTSIVLGVVTTFCVSLFYQDWYQYNNIEAAVYSSLHKLAWSISTGWLIIACATGNGGILGKLLNWKFLVPISRLTFCAYLVNGIVELYYVGQLRHPLHITFFTVMAAAISHLMLTFFLAILLCITFESPLHGIEKILLRMFAGPVSSNNERKDESRNTSQSKLES